MTDQDPGATRGRRAGRASEVRRDQARTIGVLGASGGLGATTLACGLATRAALAHREALVLDLDRGSGGVDLCLGCEREPGARWGDLGGARGQIDAEVLLRRLPRSEHGVAVLTCERHWQPLAPDTVEAVRRPLLRAVDLGVVDLGRDVPEWIHELDVVILVVGSSVSALAAAEVVSDRLLQAGVNPWLVTRNLEHRWEATVSESLEMPILARLPDERRLGEDLEIGRSPGARSRSAFTRVCDEVLREVLVDEGAVA